MDFGELIKKRRELLNMSQGELAELVGYKSRSTINKIEAGVNDVSLSKISLLARALKVSPAYLMGWELDEDEKRKKEKEANNIIANKIKNLSKDFESHKMKMAKYAGVPIEEFQKWIDGNPSPTIGQLETLGKMYGKSISYFFSNDNVEMSPEKKIIEQYRSLSEDDRKKIEDYVDLLHRNQRGK